MKKILLVSVSVLASGVSLAQEVGRVISSTPIVQQQAVPRQVCSIEQVAAPQHKSGAGALMGAIAGGAMGNAIGGGAGTAIATMVGIIGGAAIGDNIEGAQTAQMQNVQRCSTQTYYESRAVAYNVVYEYGGRQYTVQMPSDPGPTLRLQVTPVGAEAPMASAQNSMTYSQSGYSQPVYSQPTYSQPVYSQSANVVMVQPAYPVYSTGYSTGYSPGYYAQPNYFPIGLAVGLGLGYWGGGHRHGRWR